MSALARYSYLFLSLALLVFPTACASSKVQQCQKLIDITVEVSNQTKEISDDGKTKDPQEAVRVANAMEDAAEAMEDLEIQDEQLQEYRTGFVKVYRNLSQSTRDFIAELEKKNLQEAKEVKAKLQEIGTEEEDLVEGINEYCQK